jgi:hypothetical protein
MVWFLLSVLAAGAAVGFFFFGYALASGPISLPPLPQVGTHISPQGPQVQQTMVREVITAITITIAAGPKVLVKFLFSLIMQPS